MVDKKIDINLLTQAIKVLREHNRNHNKSSKKKLLLEDENDPAVYLQISLKKIPKFKDIKMIKINLPHSLLKENKEVCLITGDLDKRNHKAEIEPDVLHFKEILKKHGVDNVSEVVTLRQLRTEYKPYEAKQKLLAAYDVFLTDRKIAECLPRVLGRHFFKKRKFPIQITLNTNLKEQVKKALSTKVFYLTGHGNSCNSEVAYLDMSDQEISENVLEMAKSVCDKLPGSWSNIMGIYLKTALSKSIPVYISYDNPNEIKIEDEPTDNSFEIDELSTCPGSLVKVYNDGSVHTVRIKRMAETETYETADANGESKKKKKENVIPNSELSDDDNFETTNLNSESNQINKKSRNSRKSIGNTLKSGDDESMIKIKITDETGDISGKAIKKKKKKESVIPKSEPSGDSNLGTTDLDSESNEINKISRNSRKSLGKTSIRGDGENVTNTKLKDASNENNKKTRNSRSLGNTLLGRDDQSLINTNLKDETANVNGEAKKKKKKESIISNNELADDCSLATSFFDGESDEMNIKSTSSRKSVKKTSIRGDRKSVTNTKLKDKQTKRKSLVNIV